MFRINRDQLPKAASNYFEVVSDVHSHFTRTANNYRIEFALTRAGVAVTTYSR